MMRLKFIGTGALLISFILSPADARVVKLDVEHREVVLNGKSFGSAGPYDEKLAGKVEFALDPALPINKNIVDLSLAPRNARGEVEFTADFVAVAVAADTPKLSKHRLDPFGLTSPRD